jgi:hypothetical protein
MEPKKFPSANELLSNLIKETKVEPQPETPPTPTPEVTPIEVTSNAPTPSPEPTPVVAAEEVTIDDWDKETPAVTTPSSQTDFKTIVKDLGFEDAKDWNDVKTRIKSSGDAFEGVNDELKYAVELAKKGGDFKSFLKISEVDYTKIDPTQLYEQTMRNDPNYTKEEIQEHLDSLTPLQKKQYGINLRNQFINQQKTAREQFDSQVAQIARQREEAKAKADQALKETLGKVEKIAGLTIKPHHRQDIYDAITTGRMGQELFFDKKTGEYDYQSMIETYFVKKNLPKILEHVQKVSSSEALRKTVREMSNSTVTKPGEAPEPVATKKPSVEDQLIEKANQFRNRK